jgi:hypothetical protein
MPPRIVEGKECSVIGIEDRTSNAREMTNAGVIRKQWGKFIAEGILARIPNKVDPAVYAVYADASDRNGDYTFVIGARVSETSAIPAGMAPAECRRESTASLAAHEVQSRTSCRRNGFRHRRGCSAAFGREPESDDQFHHPYRTEQSATGFVTHHGRFRPPGWLREPLTFHRVPADTHSSATFVLSSPVINFISSVAPPQVSTVNGTFTNPTSTNPQTTSVTLSFPTPMVVGASGLAGPHTEVDIRQSLQVDGSGQITGVINPVMFIQAVKATNPEGQVTDLTGTIVSVNLAGNSFVLQAPFGHQFTVEVDGSTSSNGGLDSSRYRGRCSWKAAFWPAM